MAIRYIILLGWVFLLIGCGGDPSGDGGASTRLKNVPRNRTLIMDCAESNICGGQIQDYNSFNPFLPGTTSRTGFNFLYEPLYYYNAFKDDEGHRVECDQGRDMGFDGKTLIHPAQLDVANEAFSPSEAEADLARRQIEAFDEMQATGQGVAVVDGRIVENLHVATARETLAKLDAIAALQTE